MGAAELRSLGPCSPVSGVRAALLHVMELDDGAIPAAWPCRNLAQQGEGFDVEHTHLQHSANS